MTGDLSSLASGLVVGLVLGLVGGGGSIIATPLLLYVAGAASPHVAIGTGAIAVALSAFANLLVQAQRGLVKWPCALTFSAAGMAGALLGSSLAMRIPGEQLLAFFGLLMLIVGAIMLLRGDAEGNPDIRLSFATAPRILPMLLVTGLAVGALAGFFGIGGGFLVVPGLILATGMPITHAIATSLAAITVFGATTAANYAAAGLIDWRLAAFFVLGGIVGSAFGNLIGGSLAARRAFLNTLFAGLVIAVGLYVTWQGAATLL